MFILKAAVIFFGLHIGTVMFVVVIAIIGRINWRQIVNHFTFLLAAARPFFSHN